MAAPSPPFPCHCLSRLPWAAACRYDQGGPVASLFAGPTSSFAVCNTTSAALGYHLGAFAWGDNRWVSRAPSLLSPLSLLAAPTLPPPCVSGPLTETTRVCTACACAGRASSPCPSLAPHLASSPRPPESSIRWGNPYRQSALLHPMSPAARLPLTSSLVTAVSPPPPLLSTNFFPCSSQPCPQRGCC
jgi:hypothetical protein